MTTRTRPRLDQSALEGLRHHFEGQLVLPDDARYAEGRRIWNRMIDRRPALIAQVATPEDAARAVRFAREQGLPLSIRGGGHNVAGSALVDDGVVIDHTLRRAVDVDPRTRRVTVAPGALLGELDAATRPFGLAVPVGINTTTGVAGLALGGGIGWLMRRHGLTCDHLVEADMVTAKGDIIEVTERTEPALLWGLRGGGGNFGVVTRFVFEAVPLSDPVLAGPALYPMEQGEAVLRRYRDWAPGLGRDTTALVALRTLLPSPSLPVELHGRRVVAVVVCHIGPAGSDEALHRGLRSLGPLLADGVTRKPFVAHQAFFDSSVPAGYGYYWKSHYLSGLSDAFIDAAVELHRQAPQPWSYSLIGQLGGAIADVADGATAYPHRTPSHILNINGVAATPRDDEPAIAWASRTFDALAPFSTGGVYVNFMGDEGRDRVAAAYGDAYPRLAALKAHWDPSNVFRANQNVVPAAEPAVSRRH